MSQILGSGVVCNIMFTTGKCPGTYPGTKFLACILILSLEVKYDMWF